jgi:hypothetical protein
MAHEPVACNSQREEVREEEATMKKSYTEAGLESDFDKFSDLGFSPLLICF